MNPTEILHSPVLTAAIFGLFGLLSAMHIGRRLAQIIPTKPPALHTGHAWLDQAMVWMIQCVEDVLRSALNGDVLDNVLSTLATGNAAGAFLVLKSAVPNVIDLVIAHLGDYGPALKAFLTFSGLQDKITTMMQARLPEIAIQQSKLLSATRMADGERRLAILVKNPEPPAPVVPDPAPITTATITPST